MFIERRLFKFGIVADITEHIIAGMLGDEETVGIEINCKTFKEDYGFETGTKLPKETYKRIRDHVLEQFMFYARSKIRDGYTIAIEETKPEYNNIINYTKEFDNYSLCRKYVFTFKKYVEDYLETGHSEIWYSTYYPELERIVGHMKTLIDIINENLEAKINLYSENLIVT